MAAQFQFTIRSGPNAGKIIPLEASEIIIGRDKACTITINDAEISRKHTKLTWHSTSYVIEDIGSTNGTFVDGQRISAPYALNSGEQVSLGENIILAYEATRDVDATMMSAPSRSTKARMARPAPAPAPAPAYAGRVSAGPAPEVATSPKKGINPLLLVGIIVLGLICLCIGPLIIADVINIWCSPILRWFTNIVGPILGYGTCP